MLLTQPRNGAYSLGEIYVDGQTPYEGRDIERLHAIVQSQLPAIIASGGFGVVGGATPGDFAVTAGAGLSVSVAPGLAIVGTPLSPAVVRLVSAHPVTGLEANHGEGSPLYLHLIPLEGDGDDLERGDSFETAWPEYRVSDLEDLRSEGGVLLAKLVTTANSVTVTDRRQYTRASAPATTSALGLVKISANPTNPASPVAVGINDLRVDVHARDAKTTLADGDEFGLYELATGLWKRITRLALVADVVGRFFTTKGDLLAGTGNGTLSRLGVGASGQALVADPSTSTGLKWAAPTPGAHAHTASDISDFTVAARDAMEYATGAPVQTLAELRAVAPVDRQDKQQRLVEDAGSSYRFDAQGSGADDGDGTIAPTTGTGRWFKASSSASNTGNADTLGGQNGAYYRNRANHTGTQPASTISGLSPVATSGAYSDLTGKPGAFGASGGSHSGGLVPDPGAVAGTTRFLREDGGWSVPPGTGSGGGAGGDSTTLSRWLDGNGNVTASIDPATGTITAQLLSVPGLTTTQFHATSGSSNSISDGVKTFVVETNSSWLAGLPSVRVTANGQTHFLEGHVLTYNPSTGVLTLEVFVVSGTGTWNDWTFGLWATSGSGGGGGSYSTSALPDAASRVGQSIYVSDGDSGFPCGALSDGTNWRRFTLGSAVSAFTPATINGLQLWLKADAITGAVDGDALASWADSSGNGRNATQSTIASRPIYKTNIVKGLPVVRFDGVNDALTLGSIGSAFPVAATLFVVAKVADTKYNLYNAGPSDSYWRFNTDGAGYMGTFRNARIEQYPASVPSSGTHTWVVQSGSSGYEVFIDGASQGAQTSDYSGGGVHSIGDQQALSGDVCEIIAYSGYLTSQERNAVLNYLNTKWL